VAEKFTATSSAQTPLIVFSLTRKKLIAPLCFLFPQKPIRLFGVPEKIRFIAHRARFGDDAPSVVGLLDFYFFWCYNFFVNTGKQVKILYEPVAVRCTPKFLPCPMPQIGDRPLSEGHFIRNLRRWQECTESKYPIDKAFSFCRECRQ